MFDKLFRVSSHPLVRWWWATDRSIFMTVVILMVFGAFAVMSASVGVLDTYEVDTFHFAKKQTIFLFVAFLGMTFLSFFGSKGIRRWGFFLFLISVAGLVVTLVSGVDVKGARRWVDFGAFSIQPSEFLKPSFAVVTALLLQSMNEKQNFFVRPQFLISLLLLLFIGTLIMLQPNFSTFLVVCAVWGVQLFLAGFPMFWMIIFAAIGLGVAFGAYMLFPHVQSRIDRFLDPSSGDTYQIDQARDALLAGGFSGRGVGEGTVKQTLPDAHTDFILAVIGEEFGLLVCLVLLCLYGFIVYRGFSTLLDRDDRFEMLAGCGLLTLFSLQVFVNMGVVLKVIPTTGMALPFVSYGGSAALGMGVTIGFVLALVKKQGKYGVRKRKR